MEKKIKVNCLPLGLSPFTSKKEGKPIEEIENKAIKNRMRKVFLDTPFAKISI